MRAGVARHHHRTASEFWFVGKVAGNKEGVRVGAQDDGPSLQANRLPSWSPIAQSVAHVARRRSGGILGPGRAEAARGTGGRAWTVGMWGEQRSDWR
jgi:hypothetical protein